VRSDCVRTRPNHDSVPGPLRDAESVRDIICGPVVSRHRGGGHPSEVVVQHLPEPVVAGEADVCQCPGLAAALDHLRPDARDNLVVWKLDRLGRSVKDPLTIADDLHSRGIGLRILTGTLAGVYTPTGEGKFFFTMMAAFTELERHMIHERTMAGLAAARRHVRVGGRPRVMDGDKLAAVKARRAAGQSHTQITKALGISGASVYRHLAAATPDQP